MLKTSPAYTTLPAFVLSLSIGLCVGAPAAHAGFFEQLFGMQPPPAAEPAPTYGYGEPRSAPIYHRRAKKHVAAVDRPVKQKVTDLMHDDTLHPGDAVMMKDGIHIYEGPEASQHDAEQFVALDEAEDVTRTRKAALVAMDTTRNDPLRGNVTPDTIASGRSASVSTPVITGFKITDARGKSLRYVGP